MCRVLEVSTSGYYAWLKADPAPRTVKNADLDKEIAMIHQKTRGTYGRRRIAAELRGSSDGGPSVNRVSRRMANLGLAGYTPPAFRRTTIPEPLLEDSPNLVRDSSPSDINQIWVSDITYIATKQGWLYLCTVMDLCSRKIVGWATSARMKADLVIRAFDMAYKD